jgi:hypothetical protein
MLKLVSGLVRTPRSAAILVLLAALASGCSNTPQPASAGGAAQGVAVAIEPPSATVATGGQQVFAAAVTGTADTSVTWQVTEASCGTVSASGVYTAPGAATTCHVVVTSNADPTRSASAVVTVQAAPPVVTVAVSPPAITLAGSGQTTFTATVTGSTDTAVTWLVQEAGCGTVTAGGVYTAPAAAATCHVVATSHADPGRSASATVTVTGPPPVVTVAVTPTSASAFACETANFSATVTGTTNKAVTWSVAEAGGGTVSTAGVYTAPATDGTYHVVATSAASPTSTASAPVVVTSKVLSVSVSPSTVTVAPGATVQLTATVNTTCGTTTALTLFQAPAAAGTTN